jgi:hypothetical protein
MHAAPWTSPCYQLSGSCQHHSVIGVIHANYSVNISRHITLGPPYCDPNILISHLRLVRPYDLFHH